MTKTFAVIGDPIDHSLSPNIHNTAFKALEMDCTYIAYKIPKNELAEGIEALKAIKISGFNVTIPHKIKMMDYLDNTDEICSMIGATNTVTNENGKLSGYNTDMEGFLDPIKKRNIALKDCNILLLGAGGAARAIVAAFAKENVEKITIANRTKQRVDEIVQFANKIGITSNPVLLNDVRESEFNFIVNATSVGLRNEPSPIPTKNIANNTVVYDIVYKPMNTELIKESKKNGATVIYGYEMLLGQAAHSFKIWHGREAPYEQMKRSLVGGF